MELTMTVVHSHVRGEKGLNEHKYIKISCMATGSARKTAAPCTCSITGNSPLAEAANSPIYKKSTPLQWCACTPTFISAKILIPSSLLVPLCVHLQSVLMSPVLSEFKEALMVGSFWQARLSDGFKRKIHLVSALRKIPVHRDWTLAAGLNHLKQAAGWADSNTRFLTKNLTKLITRTVPSYIASQL